MKNLNSKNISLGKAITALTAVLVAGLTLSLASCGKQEFPEDAYWEAYSTMLSEDYSMASQQFEALTKKYGNFPEIWYNYGMCLQEQEFYDKAAKAFETAASRYKNAETYDVMNLETFRTDCLVQIGEVYILQGNMDKAEAQFQKTLSEDKENQNLQVAILATYLRTDHLNEAMAFCEKNDIHLLNFE